MDFDDVYDIKINGVNADNLVVNGRTLWERRIPASISLSVDRSVICTGETATLSALVVDSDGLPCQGVPVSFSSDIANSIGSVVSDNNGVALFSYTGVGGGDIELSASTGGLNDTVIIEDCIYASFRHIDDISNWTCSFTTDTFGGLLGFRNTNNGYINGLNLPSEFIIEYEYYPNNSGNQGNKARLFTIGTDSNNGYLVGANAGNNALAIFPRTNGSNGASSTTNNGYTNYAWNTMKVIVSSTSVTVSCGDKSVTLPKSNDVGDYIGTYDVYTHSYMRNFKVKPVI